MKVLVTGGAGYVGAVSVDALLEAGHDVVVLDDLTHGPRRGGPGRGSPRPGLVRRRGRDPRRCCERRGHRRDPPLRRPVARRGERRGPGEVLPRQRRRRDRPARGGPGGGRPPDRVLVDRRRLWRPGRRRRSTRTPRSARSTPTARPSARSRGRCAGTAGAYGLRSVVLRYFNVAGASARLGEVHRPETHLVPERAPRASRAARR